MYLIIRVLLTFIRYFIRFIFLSLFLFICHSLFFSSLSNLYTSVVRWRASVFALSLLQATFGTSEQEFSFIASGSVISLSFFSRFSCLSFFLFFLYLSLSIIYLSIALSLSFFSLSPLLTFDLSIFAYLRKSLQRYWRLRPSRSPRNTGRNCRSCIICLCSAGAFIVFFLSLFSLSSHPSQSSLSSLYP